MVEPNRIFCLFCANRAAKLGRELHAGLGVQHRLHTPCTGKTLAHLYDQVCQLDQLHKDLVHIVDQRDHITGSHAADVDLDAADIQQRNDRKVDDDIGQRVHQCRDLPDVKLHFGQQGVGILKAADLQRLLIKSTHHAHAGQILAGQAQHAVQPGLYVLVQRAGEHHDAEHHHRQDRDDHHKDQRGLCVDRERHDHCADHHKGAAQEQAQKQVQTALHLIDIAGHTGDEGAGAKGVHFRKAQALDVCKQRVAQCGGVAHRRLCGKVLGGQAARKTDDRQCQQDAAAHQDIVQIPRGDADIHDVCHHQRNEQIEGGFQHFEQRCQHAFAPVAVQIAEHIVQDGSILLLQNKV